MNALVKIDTLPAQDIVDIGADLIGQASVAQHALNTHFYIDQRTGEPLPSDGLIGELLACQKIGLMHSELSETLEGVRKSEMDKHLPHLTAEEVEMADLFLRALDYCGWRKLRIAQAIREKSAYNRTRKDHTREARLAPGGKKF
jgi:hypothetical protein